MPGTAAVRNPVSVATLQPAPNSPARRWEYLSPGTQKSWFQCINLLAGEEGPGLAAVARDLRAAISSGASFGDALQRHPNLFGPDLVAMVRVAEASGTLETGPESFPGKDDAHG